MDFKKTDDATVLCVSCNKNKHQAETEMLIIGDGTGICLKCLNLGAWLGNNLGKRRFRETEEGKNLKTPHEMKEHLDEHVIGQHMAKKTLAVAVYEHYKRISQDNDSIKSIIELDKINIMLLGSTGTGKTFLVETLAKLLEVPFVSVDISGLTAAGYVGGTIDDILESLAIAGDYDKKKIEKGIVFLDEIDKLKKTSNGVGDRDLGGASAQQQLLKMLEGDTIKVKDNNGRGKEVMTIDTKNILFILAGSFAGIEEQIRNQNNKNNPMGFGVEVKSKCKIRDEEVVEKIDRTDLLNFGMIPELMGRIPVIAKLHDLNEDILIRILKEPKNSFVKQCEHSFRLDGVELHFEDEALRLIARKSLDQRAGARGLRSIIEEIMLDIRFDIPSDKSITEFTVTKEMVTGEEGEELKTLSI